MRTRALGQIPPYTLVILILSVMVTMVIGHSCKRALASAPRFGGTLRFGTELEPTNFNPYTSTGNATSIKVCSLIYESLVRKKTIFDPAKPGGIVPCLAIRFMPDQPEIRDSIFTFLLRKDVYWHPIGSMNPKLLTSEDVKFTIDYIKNCPNVPIHIKERYSVIRSVETPTPFTVVITLDRPRYNALQLFTFYIIPKHCFDNRFRPISQSLDIAKHPIGTGPYVFDREDPATSAIVLHASKFYWNGHTHPDGSKRAYIDSIIVRIIPDTDLLHEALINGEIDIVSEVHASHIHIIKNEPQLTLKKYLNNRTAMLAFNNLRHPFTDKQVRCALGFAISREDIIRDVFQGYATAVNGPLPPWFLPNHFLRPPQEDPQLARQLLTAAGATDPDQDGILSLGGRELRLTLIYAESIASGQKRLACEYISQNLEDIGIEVDVRNLDYRSFLRRLLVDNDFELAYTEVSMESPESLIRLFRSNYQASAGSRGLNFTNFSDPRVDSLIDSYLRAMDSSRRLDLLRELDHAIASGCPSAFLWCIDNYAGQNLRLSGVRIDPLRFFMDVEDWYLTR